MMKVQILLFSALTGKVMCTCCMLVDKSLWHSYGRSFMLHALSSQFLPRVDQLDCGEALGDLRDHTKESFRTF